MRLVLLLGTFLFGCDSGGGSCDQRSGSHLCEEYEATADQLATYKSGCTGIWKDGPCARTGSVAGCKVMMPTSGITITTWYFPPAVGADIMAQCMPPNTFVSP
jgi:hypothetical protein